MPALKRSGGGGRRVSSKHLTHFPHGSQSLPSSPQPGINTQAVTSPGDPNPHADLVLQVLWDCPTLLVLVQPLLPPVPWPYQLSTQARQWIVMMFSSIAHQVVSECMKVAFIISLHTKLSKTTLTVELEQLQCEGAKGVHGAFQGGSRSPLDADIGLEDNFRELKSGVEKRGGRGGFDHRIDSRLLNVSNDYGAEQIRPDGSAAGVSGFTRNEMDMLDTSEELVHLLTSQPTIRSSRISNRFLRIINTKTPGSSFSSGTKHSNSLTTELPLPVFKPEDLTCSRASGVKDLDPMVHFIVLD
ncbi:hypothetical protein Baya_16492 [Bagarius yarrelli]|uniref:Uncharacterized protein n=1 Tax=Bagarius yarrelli TaxID=175774 RepID=A0A556VVJ1_BAGYA|nr:hypothetical protein Baya_16492 [Bagarius yarrelli]